MKIYVESYRKGEVGAVVVATALRKIGHEVVEVGFTDDPDHQDTSYGDEAPPVIDALITSMNHPEFGQSMCWCTPTVNIGLQDLLMEIVQTVDTDTLAEYLASRLSKAR